MGKLSPIASVKFILGNKLSKKASPAAIIDNIKII
jgi:hypothetical protein